jgi:hypothetical protein
LPVRTRYSLPLFVKVNVNVIAATVAPLPTTTYNVETCLEIYELLPVRLQVLR